jgi:hypothetical protein
MSFVQKNIERVCAVLKDPLLILKCGPAEKMGRRVFGNTAGLRQNLIGKTAIYTRRIAPNTIGLDTARRAEALTMRKNGYLILSELYDASNFQAIRDGIVKHLDDKQKTTPGTYSIGIRDLHDTMPEIYGLVNDNILDVAQNIFGSQVVVSDILPYRTLYVPQNVIDNTQGDIYSNRWHCDSGRTSILSFFVLLNDVDDNGGPFHLIPKQDTRRLIQSQYQNRNNSSSFEDYVQIQESDIIRKFTGKAGDVLFFNTAESLHRAELIQTQGRHRDMVRIDLRPTFGVHPKNQLYKVYR